MVASNTRSPGQVV